MRLTGATGLLGGSFNPAHRGHRAIALRALEALALDEIWWLVSPNNVLKPRDSMAPLSARVAAARRIARRSRIRVSAMEAHFTSCYTVDSLRTISRRYPKRRFVWLMGADNLAQFHRWRDWRTIAHTMPIAIIARPGYYQSVCRAPAARWLRHFAGRDMSAAVRDAARGCGVDLVTGSKGSVRESRGLPRVRLLRFSLDRHAATDIRLATPDWYQDYLRVQEDSGPRGCSGKCSTSGWRDGVTHRLLTKLPP